LEKTHSAAAEAKEEEYPALPESEPPSRESPGPEFEQREGDVDYLGVTSGRGLLEALQIDTAAGLAAAGEVRFGEPLGEHLGSGDTTPRALVPPDHGFVVAREEAVVRTHEPLDEWEVDEALKTLPPLPESRPDSPTWALSSPVVAAESRSLVEELETLPPLPESSPTSPVLSALTRPASQLPLDDELERLPALPESSPTSPLLLALPSAATQLPTDEELEQLPALLESQPSSPPLEPLSRGSTPAPLEDVLRQLPPLPESRVSSPALDPLRSVPDQLPAAEEHLKNLPALPESRDASPVSGTSAFTSAPPQMDHWLTSFQALHENLGSSTLLPLAPFLIPLVTDLELGQLPPLPESQPGSPLEEPFAHDPALEHPTVGAVLPDEQSPPRSALTQDLDRDLKSLPPLPESQPESLEVFHTPTQLPVDDELELLPPLPESQPLSPLQGAFALDEDLEPLPTPISPVEQAAVVQTRGLEDLEMLPPLPDSRPDIPALEDTAPAAEFLTSQELSVAEAEQPRHLDLETLPALPESRPDTPVAEDLSLAAEILPSQELSVEQPEQSPLVQEQDRGLNLETLPALPESRPGSPAWEVIREVTAHQQLFSPALPAEHVAEAIPAGEERELEGLLPLPESRPVSPDQAELAPAEAVGPSAEPILALAAPTQGRGFDDELPELPPLPESRPESPVQIEAALVEVIDFQPTIEQAAPVRERGLGLDLNELPPLPESRPDSPVKVDAVPAEASGTQPVVETTIEERVSGPDLEALPPLPESRPDSPTQVPTLEVGLPETSVPSSQFEKTHTTRALEPSLSQESTIQERDFAEQHLKGSSFSRPYEPPATYEELKSAGFHKRIPTPPPTRALEKQGAWDAAEKDKSNLLAASAVAAAAAAASGLVVAHMRHDDSRADVQNLEFDKMHTPGYDGTESVYSFNEDAASTIAASEAPTYLSGSTFYETQHDSGKLEDSPPRPGTLSYLLGKRGQKSQIQEEEWTAAAPSPSRKGKKKLQRELEAYSELPAKEALGEASVARAEEPADQPSLPAEETQELEQSNPERTASTRKKGKKKGSKKEVSWVEPEPKSQQQTQAGQPSFEPVFPSIAERSLPTDDQPHMPAPEQPTLDSTAITEVPETTPTVSKKSRKKKTKKVDAILQPEEDPRLPATLQTEEASRETVQESSTPQHVEPRVLSASDSGELVQKTPAESAAEQDLDSRPALPAAAAASEERERLSRSRRQADTTPAEPTKAKKGLWGSSFSMLPSIAGGVGSLFGIGKRDSIQPEKQQAQRREIQGQPESESSRDALPMQGGDPKQQHSSVEPLELPKPPLQPPSLGESSSPIPGVGHATGMHEPPDSNKSGADTASSTLDTAVWLPNEQAPAPGIPTLDPVDEATPAEAAAGNEAAVDSPDQPLGKQEGEQSNETGSRLPDQSQVLTTPDDTQQPTVDAPVAADAGDKPTDAMGKKGKANKQQRKDTPKETPKDEPVPQEAEGVTAPTPVPPVLDKTGQQDAVPELQTSPEPAAAIEPGSVTNQVADDEVSAEPAGKGKKAKKKKKKQAAAEADESPAVETPAETVASEAAPEPAPQPASEPTAELATSGSQEETAGSEVVESANAPPETPQEGMSSEPASSAKKSKKKKKKQGSQDLSEQPVEVVTEENVPGPAMAPELETVREQAPLTDSPQPEPAHEPEEPLSQSVEKTPTSQGDASAQIKETPEPVTSGKKSKKDKKKKRGSLSLETESSEAVIGPSTSEEVLPVPTMDERQEAQATTPGTTPDQQSAVGGDAAAETQSGVDALSAPESEKRVSFTTDDQPSTPGNDTTQEGTSSPTQDTDDLLSATQSKREKKKKRQSVTFAEPLEEHLGSTKARGEDDNKPKAKDSKDSVSKVPTVPPQSGDSVDEQPAKSEAQSPSAQVGVTVPFPDECDVTGPGFNLDSPQEPIEPPASRSLDQSAESETPGEVVGQESLQLDGSQQQTEAREGSDESMSRRNVSSYQE
jgi:hypothetical protein